MTATIDDAKRLDDISSAYRGMAENEPDPEISDPYLDDALALERAANLLRTLQEPGGDVLEKMAAGLWRAEAARTTSSVASKRTPQMFAHEAPETREKWLGQARAALAILIGEGE